MKLLKIPKTLTKFSKNFNQKTKSSFWSNLSPICGQNTEKIKNNFSKSLVWMSSFDHKEAADQVS